MPPDPGYRCGMADSGDTGARALLAPGIRPMVIGSVAGIARSLLTALVAVLVAGALVGPSRLPVLWLAVIIAVRALATSLDPLTRARALTRVRRAAHQRLYRHFLAVGPALGDTHRTGDVVGVATDGVDRVGAMVGRFLPLAVRGLVVPLLVAVWAMTIDLWVGAVMLVAFPAIPGALRSLERGFRDAGDRLRRSRDRLAADFLDALQGLPTLHLFDRAEAWSTTLADRSERVRRDTMDVLRVNQRALIWVDLLYSLVSIVAVVAVVEWRISAGAIGLADAVTLVLLSLVAIEPLVDVVSFFYVGALGLGALRRIRELLAVSTRRPGSDRPAARPDGRVELEAVTFSYGAPEPSTAAPPTLRSVSLTIEAGTSVALVGRSGAGKSTLASLVAGLRRPDSGRVLVDGVDVAEADPVWLAERVSMVGQDTHLFTASVAENLRMARPDATHGDLVEACRRANVLEVVEVLPAGFDTVVGERGMDLSGGEAQRLGIARAFLADTPVLVLDEATSNLDLETEALVTEAMHELMEGRTTVVIAHRITTVRRCDTVVHLEGGTVAGQGPPDRFDEGLFARMAGR